MSIKTLFNEAYDFDLISWAPLENSLVEKEKLDNLVRHSKPSSPVANHCSKSAYKKWLELSFNGDMTYLSDHLAVKEDPRLLLSRAQGFLVLAQSYLPHPFPFQDSFYENLKIASYAKGLDYHFWFKDKIKNLADELKREFPSEEFLVFTDSGPVLEREIAYQAGLGWFGKNCCLIHPKLGSHFFIGEILTTLDMKDLAFLKTSSKFSKVLPDFCGKCDKCIKACPTGALVSPRTLDARRCISYLTIETKSVPPLGLREKMQGLFFGCDICQDVCPWNQKRSPKRDHDQPAFFSKEQKLSLIQDLSFLLSSSNRELLQKFKGSALLRARPWGLRRNALLLIAFYQLNELKNEVCLIMEKDEKLKELAQWVLSKLPLP